MMVRIQIRDENGKFKNATPYDFAQTALDRIDDNGWTWMRMMFGKFCISKALSAGDNYSSADRWYARYQAIRGIE